MRRPGALVPLVPLVLLASLALPARAHDLPAGDLSALGRIWGVVNYAHPWMGYRAIDLDTATLSAIGRIRSGGSLASAVDEMLRAVGDDATYLTQPCTESAASPVDRSARIVADGVVYVSATTPGTPATKTLLRTARAVIADLRPQPGRCTAPYLASDLVPLLVRGTVRHAHHRKVRHRGYRSQTGETSGFDSTFVTIDGGFTTGESTTVTKVVFIVDERSVIPPFATGLASSGLATFVSVGTFPLHSTADHCQISLRDGSLVTLRTSELVDGDGYSAEPAPMITLSPTALESDVIAAAAQLARPRSGRRRASGMTTFPLPEYRWEVDETYATLEAPSPEQRVLAAYRLWNVVEFFYGSPELLPDWDMELPTMIAKMEHASTRRDYELALAEVMSLVPDGQAFVDAPAVLALRGSAVPPFELMQVEGKPVVVAVTGGVEQVRPGDELLRIDGRDVAERIAELTPYASGSTETAKRHSVIDLLARGAPATASLFTFRRADGSQYEVSLPRAGGGPPPTKAWRILDGNIAYVDLGSLDLADLPALFTEVASTRAMIVDLRKEMRAPIPEMARRMSTTGTAIASRMLVRELIGGALHAYETAQDIGAFQGSKYTGRTIALIDQRTRGYGEEAALAFEALAATQFVGSPSSGASGAVSHLVAPGNIPLRFTGVEVLHADGRQFVATGIEPHLQVQPTIAGLSQGRDEVLDAAIALLNQ
jgi:hypothetical protein